MTFEVNKVDALIDLPKEISDNMNCISVFIPNFDIMEIKWL